MLKLIEERTGRTFAKVWFWVVIIGIAAWAIGGVEYLFGYRPSPFN